MQSLSLIVPCYNEQAMLPLFYNALLPICDSLEKRVEVEILFINDGSSDATLSLIHKLSKKDKRIRYISFSRNFGKEAAMYAGLKEASGNYVGIMDCDMQDPPSLLPEMLRTIIEDDYDTVATRRVSRVGEPIIRSVFARAFYRLINKLSDADIVDGARDFRVMKRCVVDAILQVTEYHRFSKGIFGWVGFRTKWLEYENVERLAGETKWSFMGLLKYAIEGIVSFSTFPLRLASICGLVFSLLAVFYIIFVVVLSMLKQIDVPVYAPLVCVVLLIGGFILMALGVIGEYLARTFMQVKARPLYIISERNGEN